MVVAEKVEAVMVAAVEGATAVVKEVDTGAETEAVAMAVATAVATAVAMVAAVKAVPMVASLPSRKSHSHCIDRGQQRSPREHAQ